jgi:hypothetical protein
VAALSGKGDSDSNHQLSGQEFAAFVAAEVPRLRGTAAKPQTPVAFWPDAKPPRISPEAREALLKLAEYLSRPPQESAVEDFEEASRLCAGQPDAHLIYSMLLIRQEKTPAAMLMLDQVRLSAPDSCVAHELSAWLTFRRGEMKQGVAQLELLIKSLPQSEEPADQQYTVHAASLAGRMTGFARYVAVADRRLTNADVTGLAAVLNQRSETIRNTFRESFRAMEQVPQEMDRRIAASDNPAEKSRLELQRTSFNFHVPLDYDAIRQYLLAKIDR